MALKDLTPTQREYAIKAYPETAVKEIAKQLGVSYHSIRELMHEVGVINSRPVYKKMIRLTSQQKLSALVEFESGATPDFVAERYSVSTATIYLLLKKAGHNINPKRLNRATIDKIVTLYLAGKNTKEVGRDVGFTGEWVSKILRSEGFDIRKVDRYTPEQAKQIVLDYETGESSESIARRMGVSANCTLETLKKYGATIRSRHIVYERPAEPLFEPKFEPRQLPDLKHPGIYKFTNLVNGKVYVGQAKNIYNRYYRHTEKKKKYLFGSALKKYGIGNFDFEALERIDSGPRLRERLREREQFWMDFYRSREREFGYNLAKAEHSRLGVKDTPEQIEAKRQRMKGKMAGSLNPNWGKKLSPEHRALISKARKGTKASLETKAKIAAASTRNNLARDPEIKARVAEAMSAAKRKPIAQVNPETSETVRVWNSIGEVRSELGAIADSVATACRGYWYDSNARTRKSYTKLPLGYKWQYVI